MKMNFLKKIAVTIAATAFGLLIMPLTVKADPALQQATDFNNMQSDYLAATTGYFATYEVPVMAQYGAAMANQTAQALASNWQARMMYSQALARQATNNFQLTMNYDTMMMNLNTQYVNLMNNSLYNYQNNMNTMYGVNLEAVNKMYGYSMGQALFPQAQ